MDWINKINMIVEKMKLQMHSKGIDSLDKVFIQIAQFDSERRGEWDILKFETFLSRLGIFLKTQELTEIHKYLNTFEYQGQVQFEKFIGLLKCDVPEEFITEVTTVFNKIKDSEDTLSLTSLKQKFNVEHHPRVKLMQKEVPQVQNEFTIALQFVTGDKEEMNWNEFVDLHKNMFWVTPRDNITYFFKSISDIWGVKA